ncbi:TlpA family protein disulfide reductase [Bordetella sp. 2513F-2]
MDRRYFLYGAVAVAAVAAGGHYAAGRRGSEPAGANDAAAVAGLMRASFPDLQGRPQSLSAWQGRPLVVNFWATWCAPCVKEMPELEALHKKYPKAQFVGMGIDTVEKMQEFTRKVPVSYPLLVMGAGAIDTLRGLGNPAGGLPFTLVLNADGSIRRRILGQIDPADLERTVAELAASA